MYVCECVCICEIVCGCLCDDVHIRSQVAAQTLYITLYVSILFTHTFTSNEIHLWWVCIIRTTAAIYNTRLGDCKEPSRPLAEADSERDRCMAESDKARCPRLVFMLKSAQCRMICICLLRSGVVTPHPHR